MNTQFPIAHTSNKIGIICSLCIAVVIVGLSFYCSSSNSSNVAFAQLHPNGCIAGEYQGSDGHCHCNQGSSRDSNGVCTQSSQSSQGGQNDCTDTQSQIQQLQTQYQQLQVQYASSTQNLAQARADLTTYSSQYSQDLASPGY